MRLLVADDHELLLDTLESYLAAEPAFTVIRAPDLDMALTHLRNEPPFDLVLLDYNMPGMDGLCGLRHALDLAHDRPVALMSGIATRAVAEQALDMGAAGFLSKAMPARSLLNAITFMGQGERFVPVELFLTGPAAEAEAPGQPLERLTERERDVLLGLCQGHSNKQIARDLDLSEATVKLHVKTLYRRLGVSNRTQAAMLGRQSGLL
ncbi:response regulator transcription factor [Rhodobacteraceae bacterium 2376]|uniref:Response regulator transcription factor n=1 Tax=Rhabdonatronobacter sediminivivens TaxID=2743469 RepID=A0A7Z0HZL4_9RHOB|nr:response regulator transcription factor [Rhabdonatronobacter sediminivivens]NYS25197.1 response regulator transcription factor [Rhabdonatronobacter sediminivivens]